MRTFTRDNVTLLHCDCMDYMKDIHDNYFDLAIVDPPYGIGEGSDKIKSRHHSQLKYKTSNWDNKPPEKEYFNELFRISRNQIIWGVNHFISRMPFNSSCWIVWDKDTEQCDFADCELAWTSFKTAVKKYKFTWNGFRQGYEYKNKEHRIHPTQKPVQLYKWLLKNYTKPDMKIIDTHLGSGSSAIAAHDFGCEFVGMEIDEEYFDAAVKRFDNETRQQKLF